MPAVVRSSPGWHGPDSSVLAGRPGGGSSSGWGRRPAVPARWIAGRAGRRGPLRSSGTKAGCDIDTLPDENENFPKVFRGGNMPAKAAAKPDLSHIVKALRPLAVPCAGLVLDPANARLHSEANLDAIRGSLAVYGQRKPIVVRRAGRVVIAGNGTLEALRSLGKTHVAAVLVDDDAATAAGFAIADNRTAELAEWDQAALEALLREVQTGGDERLDRMMAELATEVGVVAPNGTGRGGPADAS